MQAETFLRWLNGMVVAEKGVGSGASELTSAVCIFSSNYFFGLKERLEVREIGRVSLFLSLTTSTA